MNGPNKDIERYYIEDELTLKDIILKTIEWWNYLWSHKFKIVGIIFLSAVIGYLAAPEKQIKYRSAIVFLVSEDNFDEYSVGALNPKIVRRLMQETNNRITELARSGKIIHEVLLSKTTINNKNDFLANHIIDIYGYHDKWNKDNLNENTDNKQNNSFENFSFTSADFHSFSEKEHRVLRMIREKTAGNRLTEAKGILDISYNVSTDLFNITVNSINSELSIELMNLVYKELQEFYIDETVGRPQKLHAQLVTEVDSLDQLLYSQMRELAIETDKNTSAYGSSNSLYLKNLSRNLSRTEIEYNNSYAELKKLTSLITKDTPEFIEIDKTFFSTGSSSSRVNPAIISAIIGGFLFVFLLISRKIILDALRS